MTQTAPPPAACAAMHAEPFLLVRHEDETGVSGTGIVADGARFPDGVCTIRWRGPLKSTATYETLATLEAIHGHGGKTTVVFIDRPAITAALEAAETATRNLRRAFAGAGIGLGHAGASHRSRP